MSTTKCAVVGEANADVAGTGVLLSFTIQAFLAIVISFYSWNLGRRPKGTLRPPETDPLQLESWQMRQRVAHQILVRGSDVQSITGFALLLAGITQMKTLSFYHLHIIYDTVSFVAVSICAAVACSFKPNMKQKAVRYTAILIWVVLYLTFTSLFAIRLRSWDYDIPGHCYNTYKIAQPNAEHPKVDIVYISLTSIYVFASLGWALGLGRLYGFTASYSEWLVLACAALQFPLHVYSIFTLRANNESLLEGGYSERDWGFGQIVAMVLLAPNVMVLLSGVQEGYRQWRKQKLRCAMEVVV